MSDDGPLSQFFDGLDEFDGGAWEVRVSFPLPDDPSALPDVTACLEAHLGRLARKTRTCVLGRTGPTTWVLGSSTYHLKRLFVGLESLFHEVLGGPEGAIDVTPRAPLLAPVSLHEPQLTA